MVERERWSIRDGERSPERVEVGALGWTLPRHYTYTLDHNQEPFVLRITCRFDGERVDVKEVVISSRNGRSVTPRDLSAVELARAVYLVTEKALEPEHALPGARRPGRQPDPEELQLVASVYAFVFAAWGKPRQAVMGLWGEPQRPLPRATANRWIVKARKLYPKAFPADGPVGGDDG